MEGPELLRRLLDQRQLTVNALAHILRKRTLQSQMQRYLSGDTKSPRPDTLAPIAKYFGIGVEAFYQPAIAKRIATELGLMDDATATSTPPPNVVCEATPSWNTATPAPTPLPKSPPSIGELVARLGRALEAYDESARKAVAALLHDMALHPETAAITGQRIMALLNVQGNVPLQKSSLSG